MAGRRAFIRASLGGLAALRGIAGAQQPPVIKVVGFLSGSSADGYGYLAAALREGLRMAGYVEGQNVLIEYRWAAGATDRLPAMAADLVKRNVAAIAAGGGSEARQAAKRATATIPIVFTTGADPVKEGLVASLSRPGGNVTGITFLNNFMEAKRLGLLREVLPDASSIGVLVDPRQPSAETQSSDVRNAARTLGAQVELLNAANERQIEEAFAALAKLRVRALLVTASALFNRRRRQVVGLAARYSLPAVYEAREYVEAGGLMSYGASPADAYRQAGVYVGRILDGADPSSLPVLQSDRYELVINLRTAATLGLKISEAVLMRADDVLR
jgi:putative ABC transport system substrate-binding protein